MIYVDKIIVMVTGINELILPSSGMYPIFDTAIMCLGYVDRVHCLFELLLLARCRRTELRMMQHNLKVISRLR